MEFGKSIAAAFVKAQKEFSPALKTSTNPHFKSKYADLSACVEAVITALNNNGIALIQQTRESENGVVVETVFLHESGESMATGALHVPAQKQDAQGYGSALTYARRYSLMSACGIAPEDDDGNGASHKKGDAGKEGDAGKAKTPPPAKFPAYTDADMEKNMGVWQTLIDTGSIVGKDIIAKVETKAMLSEAQKARILSLKRAPKEPPPPLSESSREFVEEMEATECLQ